MKTTAILLFSLAVIFTLALFYNIKADKAYNIDSPRDQMFSALIEDETYRNEFMEAMQAKYPDLILESAFAITNVDDKRGMVMLQNTSAKKYTYSLRSVADFKGKILENSLTGLVMTINDQEVHFLQNFFIIKMMFYTIYLLVFFMAFACYQ